MVSVCGAADILKPTSEVRAYAGPMVREINDGMWRVTGVDGLAGWVLWVPSRAGFHYRAHRVGRKGLGLRLGDHETLELAVTALTRLR